MSTDSYPTLNGAPKLKPKHTPTKPTSTSKPTPTPTSTSKPTPTSTPTPTPTIHVWSKLVEGKRQNIAEVEKAREAKQKQAEEARKESQLLEELTRQRRANEFDRENSKRKASQAAQQAAQQAAHEAYRASCTREKGYWVSKYDLAYLSKPPLTVPAKVNEKALEFVQLFLGNYGKEALATKTTQELKPWFCQALLIWLFTEHNRSSGAFESWEREYCLESDKENAELRYANLQKWVLDSRLRFEKNKREGNCYSLEGPWVKCPFWVFAQHITFENCLYAMDKMSFTFPDGLLEVTPLGPAAAATRQLVWNPSYWQPNSDPPTYLATRFNRKEETTLQKKRREKKEAEEDDLDDNSWW